LQSLRQNIASLAFADSTEVHREDALRQLGRLCKGTLRFHWIFIDPPYASTLAQECLQLLGSGDLLTPEGLIVVEHDRRSPPDEVYGSLVRSDSRRYGDTCVSFYERISE
jgi:16S rRNA G966 N2-methylase RsmD